MSDQPPQIPPPPVELVYETPSPSRNAPTLVRLAGIFLIISGSLDLLYLVLQGLMQGIRMVGMGGPPPPGPLAMRWIELAIPLVGMFLTVAVASLKGLGAYALLRGRRHAWGWGLAACCEFWSCPCCFASLAAGIYTIVILCLPHVSYLAMTRSDRGLSAL